MSAKSILEADGKAILNYHLTRAPVIKPSPLPKSATHNPPSRLASIYFPEDAEVADILDQAETSYPWLLAPGAKFVAKPDQLIKRRGKSGLLALNKTWPEAKAWIAARAGKPQKVETVVGVLRQFLVEPFVPHPDGTEYYININSQREVSYPPFHRPPRILSGRGDCSQFIWVARREPSNERNMEITAVHIVKSKRTSFYVVF
jgi:ATP citrate (pro-S)-lyase